MLQPMPTARGPLGPEDCGLAMLAHDIRGAVQGVLGGVVLLESAEVDAATRSQLARIGAAAETLSSLVGALLAEAGNAEPPGPADPIGLAVALDQISRRWYGEAVERGCRLVVEGAPDTRLRLRARPVTLERAVGNLVANALRYASDSEIRLTARRTAEGGLEIGVLDGGPGIPADVVEAVLRRGVRPVVASMDGHGLGLHIVQDLCREMGATLTFRNRSGGGCDARLNFPSDLVDGGGPVSAERRAERARVDLTGVRVLLAEDNPTNQIVATQMLGALNASVTLSSDGIEALEQFETGDFDLVVVDIEMPRMSGLDVIREIRRRTDGRASVPIVALTAYAMRDHRDRIAAAGANGLISKPITSVEALGEALRLHLRARPDGVQPAPATAPQDQEPVADLAVYDALCVAIGEGMMAELLDKVVADLLQARADLDGARVSLDRKPIRGASHILISVAGAVGAQRLQSRARALNTAAHGEEPGGLSTDLGRCLEEIDAAVEFARSRMVQLQGQVSR